jgi:hypothetical protein
VMPTEIGFTPRSGMGGKGHQDGEQDAVYRAGLRPMVSWIVSILNELSYRYLGMSKELTFQAEGMEIEDQLSVTKARDIALRNGTMTINERRAEEGRPLLELEEADLPYIASAGRTITFLDENGPETNVASAESSTAGRVAEDNAQPQPEQAAEAQKFITFLKKRARSSNAMWRDFNFEYLYNGDQLNALAREGDAEKLGVALAHELERQGT